MTKRSQDKWKYLWVPLIVFISFITIFSLIPLCQEGIAGDKIHSETIKFNNPRPPIPAKYKGIRNPLQKNEKNLTDGEQLYDNLCSRCHGGNMDGKGPEALGFFPPPADLAALVSNIKPPESYLFWRIREGGRVLPMGFAPWNSAMPAWQEELTDDKIWKVIIYIYDATGAAPP